MKMEGKLMGPLEHSGEGEHPRNHLYQLLVLILFLLVWGLDSFVFRFSTMLSRYVPLWIRLPLALLLLVRGWFLMKQSYIVIFKSEQTGLVSDGLFGRVRNPMYLGVLHIYKAVFVSTLSLISLIPLLIAFFTYDRMVSFEEARLEEKFGEAFLEYKRKIPKWFLFLK